MAIPLYQIWDPKANIDIKTLNDSSSQTSNLPKDWYYIMTNASEHLSK